MCDSRRVRRSLSMVERAHRAPLADRAKLA